VPNVTLERRIHHVFGFGTARDAAEHDLESKGIVLPFPQRGEWHEAIGHSSSALVVASDTDGRARAAAGIGIGRSRALPLHRIYRVERLGSSPTDADDSALLKAIADAAHSDRLCIRLHLGIFEPDAERRQRLGTVLGSAGFVRAQQPESYRRTPSLDLEASEEVLFSKLAASARRNVRVPSKRGLQLLPIDDPSYAGRLTELLEESFRRTGGSPVPLPWQTILQRSGRSPHRSRVVGLFKPEEISPSSLVAFAWGCVNGNYVTYEAGAASRQEGLGNMPLAYAPLWDLIAWARRIGAKWFDFGGVSAVGESATDDPLGGITDFKKFFCERIIEVRDEWTLEPRPLRATIARAVSAAANRIRR